MSAFLNRTKAVTRYPGDLHVKHVYYYVATVSIAEHARIIGSMNW